MGEFNIVQYLSKKFSKVYFLISFIFFLVFFVILFTRKHIVSSLFYKIPVVSSLFEVDTYFEEGKHVVKLKIEELIDIGYEVETITTEDGVETNRRKKSFYCVVPYDTGMILVEMPYSYQKNPNAKYTDIVLKGVLEKPDFSEQYHREVYSYLAEGLKESLKITLGEANQLISPVFLNVEKLSTSTYVFIYVFIVLFILSLFFMIKSLLAIFDYTKSSLYKSLSDYCYPEDVENQIIEEYNDSLILNFKYGCVLPSFILYNKVYLTDDLIWAYGKTHNQYGIVTYSIVLNFTNRKSVNISVKDKLEFKEVLITIGSTFPVFIGFYDEYINLFNKKNLDTFIDLFEQRKREFYSDS